MCDNNELSSECLLNDLKQIILGEIQPYAEQIVNNYSGKTFSVEDIINIFNNNMDKSNNDCIKEELIEDKINEDNSLCMNDPINTNVKKIKTKNKNKEISKKRKNKISGFTVFKNDNKKLIQKIYLKRKKENNQLKSATIAGELWDKADKQIYIDKANKLNEEIIKNNFNNDF